MSTENEEKVRERLKSELERLGLSAAEVGRRIGEKDYKIRDILGRRRLTADMLGKMVIGCGIDANFILTGQRNTHQITIDNVKAAFQMVADAEAQLPEGQYLTSEQRVGAVCSLLKTAEAVGKIPDQSAAIAVLMALQ